MCPASERGAMPQALMVSVDRDLIMASGSQCPMTIDRSVSIRRLTDFAITRFHPRKLFGSGPHRGLRRLDGGRPRIAEFLEAFLETGVELQ